MRASKLLLVLCLTAIPAAAAAQPASGPDAARPLAEKGIELYHRGETAEALELLTRAEAIFDAPVQQVYIARANAKLGRLLEAQRRYRKVISAEPNPNESPAVAAIRDAARRESDALRERIPSLTVSVAGANADTRASVDGSEVSLADLERGMRLDPGEHDVEISAQHHRVTLREGRGERLDVALGAAEPEAPAPGSPAVESPAPTADEPAPSRAPAILALSVGAAGLALGAVTGVITLSNASELKATCKDGHCPRDQADRGDDVGKLAAISTVSFAVGAAGIVTGVVLLTLRPAKPTAGGAPPVRVAVGLASLSASGSF